MLKNIAFFAFSVTSPIKGNDRTTTCGNRIDCADLGKEMVEGAQEKTVEKGEIYFT